LWWSAHYLDGPVGNPLGVKVPVFSQAENDLRELEAGGLYRRRAAADVWRDPLPSVVESLP
ncbi:MAG TPA: hypothetical protein VFY92_06835, partial [Hyphomicrobiaceae bacterium]|nr:hypothetical protein [Hyphomicrobiaceae bacterium]